MWTYAIAFVLLAIVWEGRSDDISSSFSPQYLLLLGIPVVGATGASLITTAKEQSGSPKPTDSPDAAPNALAGIREGIADVVTDDAGRGDLGDFQYFIFNLVALTFFFVDFFAAAADGLPIIPDTLVALTGASAFAYLSKKGVVTNDPRLTGVYPSAANAGEEVTIRGVNLLGPSPAPDPMTQGLIVLFEGRLGEAVTVDSNGTIVKATVPLTAPSSASSDVRVVTPGGVQTDTLPFTILPGSAATTGGTTDPPSS
jgi:hypothetical protein